MKPSSALKKGLLAGAASFFFLQSAILCTVGIFSPVEVYAQAAGKYYAPQLEVDIPGLDFSKNPVVLSNTAIQVPFFGAYVAAIYRNLIGVSIIAAAVMIVYGGVKYIVASSISSVQSGKEIIADAIVGMFLVISAFTILNALNPALIQPKPVELYQVVMDPYVGEMIQSSFTTIENTDIPPPVGDSAPPPTPSGSGQPKPPPAPPRGTTPTPIPTPTPSVSGNCPFPLPAEIKSDLRGSAPRRRAFLDAVRPMLTGAYTDRVAKAANLAAQCDMMFGSCGTNINTLLVIAGVGPDDCLKTSEDPKKPGGGICNWDYRTLVKYTKGSPLVPVNPGDFRGWHTPNNCGSEKAWPPNKKTGKPNAMLQFANKPDALPKGQAVQRVRDVLSAKIPGYPNTFADQLQPGDWIYDYNANNDCNGNHSVLFVGWKDTNGNANVLGGDVTHPIHLSTVCLKTTCGKTKWLPLISIIRPNAASMRP